MLRIIVVFGVLVIRFETTADTSSQCPKDEPQQCFPDDNDENSIRFHENIILRWQRNVTDNWAEEIIREIDYTMWKRLMQENNALEFDVADSPFGSEASIELPAYKAECDFRHHSKQTKPAFRLSKKQMILIEDSKSTPTEGQSPAEATLPCLLYLDNSPMIAGNKNRGVFAKVPLPKGVIFGPYVGEEMKFRKNKHTYHDLDYAWKYYGDHDYEYYIDGSDESKSNWIRFVNSARFEEEQNLMVVNNGAQVFYYLYKDVAPKTELLVYYGDTFARSNGIKFLSSAQDRAGFAARRIDMECPVCINLPSVDEIS